MDACVVRLEAGTTKNEEGRTFPFGQHPSRPKTARLQRAIQGSPRVIGEVHTRLEHLKKAIDDTPGSDPTLADKMRSLETRLRDIDTKLTGDAHDPGPQRAGAADAGRSRERRGLRSVVDDHEPYEDATSEFTRSRRDNSVRSWPTFARSSRPICHRSKPRPKRPARRGRRAGFWTGSRSDRHVQLGSDWRASSMRDDFNATIRA